jgi:hypothetical protein
MATYSNMVAYSNMAAYSNIMTHLASQNTRFFGAVVVDTSLRASCSGTSEQIQNSCTTHRVGKSSSSTYSLILAQSPRTTTLNRGFSAATFEAAMGGAA